MADAFLAASRKGDFDALVAVLDPDVVLRVDGGAARPGLTQVLRGAEAIAARAMQFRRFGETARVALVNGALGGVAYAANGSPFAVMGLTIRDGKIVAMDVLADPERIREIDLTVLDD